MYGYVCTHVHPLRVGLAAVHSKSGQTSCNVPLGAVLQNGPLLRRCPMHTYDTCICLSLSHTHTHVVRLSVSLYFAHPATISTHRLVVLEHRHSCGLGNVICNAQRYAHDQQTPRADPSPPSKRWLVLRLNTPLRLSPVELALGGRIASPSRSSGPPTCPHLCLLLAYAVHNRLANSLSAQSRHGGNAAG